MSEPITKMYTIIVTNHNRFLESQVEQALDHLFLQLDQNQEDQIKVVKWSALRDISRAKFD